MAAVERGRTFGNLSIWPEKCIEKLIDHYVSTHVEFPEIIKVWPEKMRIGTIFYGQRHFIASM